MKRACYFKFLSKWICGFIAFFFFSILNACDFKALKFSGKTGLIAEGLIPTEDAVVLSTVVVAEAGLTSDGVAMSGSSLTCTAEYPAKIDGSDATATFIFYNLKSKETPRATIQGSAGTKTATYTLRTMQDVETVELADVRGDKIACQVVVTGKTTTATSSLSSEVTLGDAAPRVAVASGELQQSGLAAGGAMSSVQLSGTDPDGDAVTFTQSSSDCAGITVNATSGVISGTVPNSSSPPSDKICTSTYKAVANDLASETSITVSLEVVNHAPTLSCVNATQTLAAGAPVPAGIVCTGSDSDAGSTLSYAISGCPSLTIDSSTGAVSGVMGKSSCTATVTVSDGALSVTADVVLNTPTREFTTYPQGVAGFTSLPSTVFYSVALAGNKIFLGSDGGLAISSDNGTSFVTRTVADGLGSNSVVRATIIDTNVFVGTFGGGLAISTDSGTTFVPRTKANGLGSNNVTEVYVDSENGRIYASTGYTLTGTSTDGGLSISTDGGKSFVNKTKEANGLGSNVVFSAYAKNNVVYAATSGGFSVSTDWGNTFTNRTTANGLGSNQTINILVGENNRIYVATWGGISVSTDGGATFTTKTFANGLAGNLVTHTFEKNGKVYLSTTSGLSISSDGATTFAAAINTGANPTLSDNLFRGVAVNASGHIYAATDDGFNISTDGGSTWTVKRPTTGAYYNNIYSVHVNSNKVYLGSKDGYGYSTDTGSTFTRKDFNVGAGITAATVYQIIESAGTVYLAADDGLYSTTDNAVYTTRTSFDGLGDDVVNGVAVSGVNVYAATDSGISVSNDSGVNFVNQDPTAGASRFVSVVTSGTTVVTATSASGIYISTDSGTSFVNRTKAGHGLASNKVNAVYIGSGGKIYAATQEGLSVSTNGGTTFSSLTTANGLAGNDVLAVYESGGKLYVGTRSGLSVSSDGGATFTNKTYANGLSSNVVQSILVSGSKLYIGTAAGLSVSSSP